MPKITFGGNTDLAKNTLGDIEAYDEALLGVPPKGIYRLRVKRLIMKKNRNQDWMLNAVGEIAELNPIKAKYNAYGVWFNLNVNEKGSKGVNNFLDALSGGNPAVREKFWGPTGVKVSDDKLKPAVLAIGPLKIDAEGMYVHALLRNETDQTGKAKLGIDRFLMRNGEPSEAAVEDEEGDVVVVDESELDEYVGDGSDAGGPPMEDDYEDEAEFVEEAPAEPEETGADVQESTADFTDEPPF